MECPNCHSKGSVFKRVFSRKKGSQNRFCVFCGSEVKITYNWKKIFILCIIVMLCLFVINIVIQLLGAYGLTSGFSGGLAAAVIAIFMRKPPYTVIELVNKPGKKHRH